jgi:pseudaminic acid synthase
MAMIPEFAKRFNVIPGLSDHTLGSTVLVVAKIIEKHFILDRSTGGRDDSFSMNEQEIAEMVKAEREAEQAIGQVSCELTDKQIKGHDFSRSLYVVKDIKKGEVITEEHVKSIRTGFGGLRRS